MGNHIKRYLLIKMAALLFASMGCGANVRSWTADEYETDCDGAVVNSNNSDILHASGQQRKSTENQASLQSASPHKKHQPLKKNVTNDGELLAEKQLSRIPSAAVGATQIDEATGGHYYFSNLANDNHLQSIIIDPVTTHSMLLIVVDALNAQHIGTYGYHRMTTPFIDQLAKEGVVFTEWVSNSSWTRPSFTTILTGVPKSIHGMELTDSRLPSKINTMAETLHKNNIRTAAFIGNPLIQKKWNYQQGFDQFKDASVHGDFPPASVLVDEAIEWLQKVKGERFFGVIFLSDTHAPYSAPEDWNTFSKKYKNINISPSRESVAPLSEIEIDGIKAAYDDELRYADAQIGRLLEWLQETELYDTTSIMVTADHGEMFGEHGCFQHAYHMWEPVLRVPMVIKSPALNDAGISHVPATHLDTMPTILHLFGLSTHTAYGTSVFSPKEQSLGKIIPLASSYDAGGVRRQSARLGTLKLIRYEKVDFKNHTGSRDRQRVWNDNPSLQIPGPRYELFELRDDPREENNIYPQTEEDESLRTLKKAVKYLGDVRPHSGKKIPALDGETLRALQAAGYIE